MQISRYTILFPILISLLTCTETRVEYVPCLDVIIGDHEETVSDLFDIPIDQELYIEPPPDFGKKCDKNTDCLSGLCVEGVDGFLCSVKCIEDCPAGFVCKSVAIFPDVIFGCVPEGVSLCKPCKQDSQCSGGLCMALKEGNYCTRNCANTGCPERYKCVEITKENGDVTKECVPENGSCTCNVTSENNERPCVNKNEIGTCLGFEKCDVNLGWTGCTAATPAAEVCDGVDNDCNGVADDQPAPPVEECANENEFGKCVGTWVCKGLNGWDCLAEIPHAEACNFIDDDCDGLSDEDFKVPDTNKYGDYYNCGICGNSCDGVIPNAKAKCDVTKAKPICVVEECDEGYYQVSELSCLSALDSLCMPCQTDANCPVPGDRCLALQDGKYCGKDCSATNVYGTPEGECPETYQCVEIDGNPAVKQCVPKTNACTCRVGADDGKLKPCVNQNEYGVCTGIQICFPDSGWGVCSAIEAVPEKCDGKDNDCDGGIDETFTNKGTACSAGTGECYATGVFVCKTDQTGTECNAIAGTPTSEKCDGKDNNCNGTADETFTDKGKPCTAGQGECLANGVYVCKADQTGTECNAVPGSPASETCDGKDNNCNGSIDETFTNKGKPCTAGVGECLTNGVYVCKADGSNTECNAVPGSPTSETCDGKDNNCNGSTDETWPEKGTACYNGLGICRTAGVYVCKANQTGTECNAVPGSPQTEACNYLDDDCDGSTDETFISGGKYYLNTNCGNCFTDCTQIWTPLLHNANGVCNSVPSTPVCTYTCLSGYVDADGNPNNGCELFLDPSVLYVATVENGGVDNSTCGAWNAPCMTISYGLSRASSTGKTKVYASAGLYAENVTLINGINLLGGYDPVTWQRNIATNFTIISGTTPNPQSVKHKKAVQAINITSSTEFSGFIIYGENNFYYQSGDTGGNSYAIYVRDSSSALVIKNNTIYAGRGSQGADGSNGSQGTNGSNGSAGQSGVNTNQLNCSGFVRNGGGGGSSGCGSAGGAGGNSVCPSNNNQQASGSSGSGSSPGSGGAGGYDRYVTGSPSCGTCYTGGFSSQGSTGTNGTNGSNGTAGSGCSSGTGNVSSNEWTPGTASSGASGSGGSGGGGGGAGGGVDVQWSGCTNKDVLGGAGGGGGSGGCGGTLGQAAPGGGGSFAIFVLRTGSLSSAPAITNNVVVKNHGGAGGKGGSGGNGGAGGFGGLGGDIAGLQYEYCLGKGSNGGFGGFGGHGGGGGGGCGGVSYGIYTSNLSGLSPNYCQAGASNSFSSVGSSGSGGQGGGSAGNQGTAGSTGANANCQVN